MCNTAIIIDEYRIISSLCVDVAEIVEVVEVVVVVVVGAVGIVGVVGVLEVEVVGLGKVEMLDLQNQGSINNGFTVSTQGVEEIGSP